MTVIWVFVNCDSLIEATHSNEVPSIGFVRMEGVPEKFVEWMKEEMRF